MVKPIPKWVMERYAKLWKRYDKKTVTYDDIEKVLTMDDTRMISVFLNELKTAGWINVELDPKDARKRQYTLKNPEIIVQEIAKK